MTFKEKNLLPKLLRDRGIRSFESLTRALDLSDNFLNAETADSLGLDPENRLYNDIIDYQQKVFLTDILIKNATTITFANTVLEGKLTILDPSRILKKIIFDYVIAKERIFLCLPERVCKVSLYGLNCKELVIQNGNGCTVDISGSTIFDLYIEGVELQSFRCVNSIIGKFSVNNFQAKEIDFDHSQIDFSLLEHNEESPEYLSAFSQFDLFNFTSSEDILDQLSEKSTFTTSRDTLDFLSKYTDVYLDKKSYSKIRSLYSKLYLSKSKASYFFMCLAGHFVRPWLFLLYILLVLLMFALAFSYNGTLFIVEDKIKSLSFLEALYFSGVTLTTTGYGDITPIGISRLLAVLESIFGVFLMSSYLVTLYRKYVEK